MLDLATLSALATSTVAILTPLLQKALEKGVEEVGKSTAGTLFEKLKQRLGHAGAQEALEDLTKQPDDADTQAGLRVQLKKALEADPELGSDLQRWIAESMKAMGKPGHTQNATVSGDHSKVVQIIGSRNSGS